MTDSVAKDRPSLIQRVGTWTSVFKDLLVLVTTAWVLLAPSHFGKTFQAAGFESVELGELKIKLDKVEEQKATVEAQKATVEASAAELSQTAQAALNEASNSSTMDTTRSLAVRDALKRTEIVLAESARGVAMPETKSPSASDQRFAVVFGADLTVEAAKPEVANAKRALRGKGTVVVVKRGRLFRTVVLFDTRDDARAALQLLRNVRGSAYVVAWQTWCPSAQTGSQDVAFECPPQG